eukprot:TRINITY_DN20415_c0_g1_i1.p1 TRINITY_DN20415_c0_g1~~TRINITY_DN20415_c0_g1_i1.p1  ORF type:complete len:202 (+),score=22.72 TRINITY_DN20415_c0_g1_i1:2-607(+)
MCFNFREKIPQNSVMESRHSKNRSVLDKIMQSNATKKEKVEPKSEEVETQEGLHSKMGKLLKLYDSWPDGDEYDNLEEREAFDTAVHMCTSRLIEGAKGKRFQTSLPILESRLHATRRAAQELSANRARSTKDIQCEAARRRYIDLSLSCFLTQSETRISGIGSLDTRITWKDESSGSLLSGKECRKTPRKSLLKRRFHPK